MGNEIRDVITYRGCMGSTTCSAEDEVFYGKIEARNALKLFKPKHTGDQKGIPWGFR